MSYTTEFSGDISVIPPLNSAEIAYLQAFATTWHGEVPDDPYYTETVSDVAKGTPTARLIPFEPVIATGHPGEACHWIPTDDGTAIVWNGCGVFNEASEWMSYIIDHFLTGRRGEFAADRRSAGFTFDHLCAGRVDAQGEDPADSWTLLVQGNIVRRRPR